VMNKNDCNTIITSGVQKHTHRLRSNNCLRSAREAENHMHYAQYCVGLVIMIGCESALIVRTGVNIL
jgi:hypothetical protein